MYLAFLLLISLVQADTFNYHLPLNICSDIATFEQSGEAFAVLNRHDVIPVAERETYLRVVQSNWNKMECRVENESVRVVASFEASDYPITSVPSTALCSVTDSVGHTHNLFVHPHLMDEDELVCWPIHDAWYPMGNALHARIGSETFYTLPLLTDHSYVTGTYQAKTSAGLWPGVFCEVRADKTMQLSISINATAGEGYCPIPDGIGTLKVPFEFDRVE
jgi:hypothetical protein